MRLYKLIILVLLVILFLGLGSTNSQAVKSNSLLVHLPVMFYTQFTGFSNPSFESGTDGWVVQSNQGDNVVTTAKARSGMWSAALGNGNNYRLASIAQQVQVPQEAYVVTYFQWVESLELCASNNNRVTVLVNSQPYQHYNVCQDSDNGKWVERKIYLAPYKGQTVVFRLEFQSSSILNNYLYVDDFSFEVP
jgi:hypothetical protein